MSEMPQAEYSDYEAIYISENFGLPFTAALKITQEKAKKNAEAEAKKPK